MNLMMDYNLLINLYCELKADKFFKLLEEAYKQFNLYTMSQSWLESNEYILKFKGSDGDIIINWI